MKFIRPIGITDAKLVSSTVPETDYSAWNAATAYTVGQRVIRTTTHRVYERLIAGTTATAPESDAVNWLDIGPTNRWAMFDEKVGTETTASGSMTVVLAPGRINSLALLGVEASTVTVALVAGGQTVYEASLDLDSGNKVGNWYEYFYEPIYQQTEVVITNLLDAALLDVPGYGEGQLTVTLSRPGETVRLGVFAVGLLYDVGQTEYEAEVSIRDYSRKEADDFGNYTLVKRDYSKTMSLNVVVPADRVDSVAQTMARHRATNVVWIGSTQFGSLIVYGFLADWRLVAKNYSIWSYSAKIEGMT